MIVQDEVDVAVHVLLRGYGEEANLYSAMRELSLRQLETLRDRRDLARFSDLLDEKEDILRLIGQIDSEMVGAKTFVMTLDPEACPNRDRLRRLLDRVTGIIEDLRAIESENVRHFEGDAAPTGSEDNAPRPALAARV